MSNQAIVVEDLVKTFKGDVKAVQGISFEVEDGEFFAFLGPNGAGKSTTIQVLTTLLNPTSGSVTVSGFDVGKDPISIRREIGVALQETGIDPSLTGRELLEMQARLFGFSKHDAKNRAQELLDLIHLAEDGDRKVGKYSGGMRRRLDLSLCLVHRPKILFLDEPTTGLDPYNRNAIWDEIRTLNREFGTTIFLTTQYLEEADQLADRISIINKGKIVASGSSQQLKKTVGMDVIDLSFQQNEDAEKAKEVLSSWTKDYRLTNGELTLYVDNGAYLLPDMVRKLDKEGIPPISLNLAPPTLDDVFLQVTGEHLEEKAVIKQEGVVSP
ncbi:ATP-binding cassette domain-containing protein [Chengkuizengella axinellae]|uniref:ATP-binding cassette domain-containing protein n=1 Tax=Chengkuizengella axinellae TaxID=3064388 RepID=A0ABT9IY87_9BACL|nr:ATP-binding cassette domain-containing protein [Chengkuizengella sp. 2205SS18-9]MDP5274321.1 ATP-binding cassette domain-containing protein [Chengkuizengella sp. 2205SS18-9]